MIFLVVPVWGAAIAILMQAAQQPHEDYFDAQVFLGAARAVVNGESPYGQYFVSPLWTAILLSPLALLPLTWAAAALFWANLGGWLLTILLTLRMLRQPWGWQLFTLAAALMVFPPVVWSTHGQVVVYPALGVVLFMALVRRYPGLAGTSLALLMIKPHLGAWLVLLLAIWSLRRGQWKVPLGFSLVFGGLAALSFLVQPGWAADWLAVLRQPPAALQPQWEQFGPTGFYFLRLIVGEQAARVLAISLAIGLGGAMLCWLWRSRPIPDVARVLTLAIPILFFITPYAQGYDLSLLYLPLAVFGAMRLQRRVVLRPWQIAATGAVYLFPWVMPFMGWPQPVFVILPVLCLALWPSYDWPQPPEER